MGLPFHSSTTLVSFLGHFQFHYVCLSEFYTKSWAPKILWSLNNNSRKWLAIYQEPTRFQVPSGTLPSLLLFLFVTLCQDSFIIFSLLMWKLRTGLVNYFLRVTLLAQNQVVTWKHRSPAWPWPVPSSWNIRSARGVFMRLFPLIV